jgi:hypothetical protein
VSNRARHLAFKAGAAAVFRAANWVRTVSVMANLRQSRWRIAEIAGSIRTFGFTNPLLVGEDADVVAGHGRLAAARLLGLTEVPVIPLRNLDDVERRQLMLADNRIALNAGWDAEMLMLELTDLGKLGTDLRILGFSEQELAVALGAPGAGLVPEDEVPALGEVAISRPGDVWLLGPHRVGCGDCRDAATVFAVLAGTLPQLMVTDPPYGVEYDPEWRHRRASTTQPRRARSSTMRSRTGHLRGAYSRAK